MATSNFYVYEKLPLIAGLCDDEVYFEDEEQQAESRYCILSNYDIEELEEDIKDFNSTLENRIFRLSDSPRLKDQNEAINLKDCFVEIKPGYYEVFQLYAGSDNDLKYINKTSLLMIKRFFLKMQKKYSLNLLSLDYRFSNGETGFNIIK